MLPNFHEWLLMSVQTEFILPSASLAVTHEPTTGDPGRTGQGVAITEADITPDTLTTIKVRVQDKNRNVYVLWRPQSWSLGLSILYVQESSTLFVGGSTFSAVVDINEMRLKRQHNVDLFWSFKHTPNSVLELGEIECFLYSREGDLIGSVPVDPPYDIIERDNEVEFVTSLFGIQRISFP